MIPQIGEASYRTEPVEIRRSSDDRRTVVKINTIDRDTYNTVIEPKGLDTTRYMKNPVVLINHDENLPVTSTSTLQLRDDGWVATTDDDDWDKDDPEAMRWFRKVKSGLIRGASIRFLPKEIERDDSNPDDPFYRIVRSELLEWSYVTVQSNPSTLVAQRAIAYQEIEKRMNDVEAKMDKRFDELRELTEKIKSGFYRSTEEIILRLDEISKPVPQASAESAPKATSAPAFRMDDVVQSLTKRLDELVDRKLGRA